MCYAEATPEDVVGVLTASGVWGAVHESAESGPFNANVLDGTPAILDNIDTFDALHAVPSMITVAGGSAGFGPRAINITLTQVPPLPSAHSCPEPSSYLVLYCSALTLPRGTVQLARHDLGHARRSAHWYET